VFIAVGTPTRRGDGHADLSYVYSAAAEIAEAIRAYTVVVTKSTVPVGTGREVARIIREARPSAEFDVASNPEFLREGAAIEDFMKPDRVVIGVESQRARDVMSAVYRPLNLIQTPMVFTNIETAEVTKYAGNAFLATKITFINEIADLCEKVGADVHDVARGIGLDGRIGRKFLHPGPGFGGSCFPKDTLALAYTAREANAPQTIVEQVIEVNNARKKKMAQKVIDFCGGSIAGASTCGKVFVAAGASDSATVTASTAAGAVVSFALVSVVADSVVLRLAMGIPGWANSPTGNQVWLTARLIGRGFASEILLPPQRHNPLCWASAANETSGRAPRCWMCPFTPVRRNASSNPL